MLLPASILVIEDDDVYATLLAERLSAAGCQVRVTGDAGSASEALRLQAFDAIVADLHLPDTDGLLSDTLLDAAAGTPMILMTGTPTLESALQAMQRHAFSYHVKPIEMALFLDSVERAVRHRHLQLRVQESLRRYQAIEEQLDALKSVSGRPDGRDVDQSFRDYLRLLLGSGIESIAEAIDLLGVAGQDHLSRPVRRLSRHPEAEMFRAAVEQTVSVLEKSKNSFKSRELADLRRQLEAALKLGRDPAAPE